MTLDSWRGLDIETQSEHRMHGLQPHRLRQGTASISAISIADEETSHGKLYPDVEHIRKILAGCAKNKLPLVGWNIQFDAAWLIAMGLEEEVFACQWFDGMLFWRHLTNEPTDEFTPKAKRRSYALEAAMKEFYPENAGFKDFTNFDATDEESLKGLLNRNRMDALYTLKLAKKFYSELTDKQKVAALIEARCIPQFARTSVEGLCVDLNQASKLDLELEQQGQSTYNELLDNNPEIAEMSLASPKQLAHLLFDQWELPILKTSIKTQEPSTDKEVLYELAAIDPRADAVRTIREAKNNRTKFVTAIITSAEYNGDGRVRPSPRIFGTYTGRATYSSTMTDRQVKPQVTHQTGFAIHQTKRDASFRRVIVPPEGYDLVELDFAGQEFRWMAVASEDDTMLELCAPGEDAHAFMGSQVARRDYRELQRLASEEEKQAKSDRNLGKFCIAEGELVLTNQGLVPIEDVSLDHRVWDGVEWVEHSGVVYQGLKEAITYEGLTATPDHIVYTDEGFRCFHGDAATLGLHITDTGDGRKPVWSLDNPKHRDSQRYEEAGCLRTLCLPVRSRGLGLCVEPAQEEIDTVQSLPDTRATRIQGEVDSDLQEGGEIAEASQRNASTMCEPQGFFVPQLRSEGDRVQVCECQGSCRVYPEGAASPELSKTGHRQGGQRRALRTQEPAPVFSLGELEQQTREEAGSFSREGLLTDEDARTDTRTLSGSEVFRLYYQGVFSAEKTGGVHHPKVARVCKVYDVTNAGPRHRYTVSGKLVANSNLSFQYRIGSKSATSKARVQYGLNVDESFIKNILDVYKKTYPGVPNYWKSMITLGRRQMFVETFAGRRVSLSGWNNRNSWEKESTAINYPIQGSGADQKYLALAVARNELPQFCGHIYFELHDGLFFIFPKAKTEKATLHLTDKLSNLPYKQAWGIKLPIAFPVDAKIGSSWGDLKNFSG